MTWRANKMVNQRIRIDNGWIVEIEIKEKSKTYYIVGISALFGHGVYLPVDTSDFTQEQWNMFHDRVMAERGG